MYLTKSQLTWIETSKILYRDKIKIKTELAQLNVEQVGANKGILWRQDEIYNNNQQQEYLNELCLAPKKALSCKWWASLTHLDPKLEEKTESRL